MQKTGSFPQKLYIVREIIKKTTTVCTMSIKVTPEIIQALRSLIDEWGSALEIERRTHVANSSISRYLSGRLPRMNDSTWRALAPHLARFMPKREGGPDSHLPMPYPPEDIFQKIVYDETLSGDEKIKFLKMIVPPPFCRNGVGN